MTARDAAARAEARIGTVLNGKYRVDSVLGSGGMAVIYEVTHRNQKRFALKMLHTELSSHDDIRRRFLREGYAANSVGHPGAVAVLDDDMTEDGAAFLVMELLDGLPLDDILGRHQRRLPAEAVLAVADQLLDVLSTAHGKGIVHRDIKPANLFVSRDGTLKVLDFGIARVRQAAGSSQATHTGVMLGTPAYMPPEQALALASQIDAQTDLWSVGATLFNLLSGANVHPGQTATQILIAAATHPARSVTTVAPWVDPRVARVVDRALAFEKKDRWPSAEAMRGAVQETHQELFGGPPTSAPLAAFIGPGERRSANPNPFVPAGPSPSAYSGQERGNVASPSPEAMGGGVVRDGGTRAQGGPPPASPGTSTATPVSSGTTPAEIGPGRGARGGLWLAVAAVGLGAGGLLFFAIRGGDATPAPAIGERSAPPTVAVPIAAFDATPDANAEPAPDASANGSPGATPAASAIPRAVSTGAF
jgi:serine/threonine protein kinase